ncbi:hypothetical protein AB6834_00340 [Carnobacterium divergens]|uniref:hypothetical protein n=1 Tax=Carnobacterium TaxID=2747 RepID=UPI00068B8DFA|nr:MULTISPECIES: hypothetical protein [Carnobacterium]
MEQININFSTHFKKMWFNCGLDEMDLADLEKNIIEFEHWRESKDQVLGDLIAGTGGAIKLRFTSSKSKKGKSGSERAIYCAFDVNGNIREYNFILCYAKNSKETLTSKEKKALKNVVKELKKNRPN